MAMLSVSTGEIRGKRKSTSRDANASTFDRYPYRPGSEKDMLLQRIRRETDEAVAAGKYDDPLMTKEDYFARIDLALADVAEGKVISFPTNEELFEFLENL